MRAQTLTVPGGGVAFAGLPCEWTLEERRLMSRWQCIVCGFIYDEAEGWPEDGIAPGTRWEDVPGDWQCPDCGVGKEDFELISHDSG